MEIYLLHKKKLYLLAPKLGAGVEAEPNWNTACWGVDGVAEEAKLNPPALWFEVDEPNNDAGVEVADPNEGADVGAEDPNVGVEEVALLLLKVEPNMEGLASGNFPKEEAEVSGAFIAAERDHNIR